MARRPAKVPSENDIILPGEETPDLDEDNLRAIADVFKNQGNEEYRKKDFINAIHFYTEGIKVNCQDKELKAQLYSNRAIANFKLGNYLDSLCDAKAATELRPSFLKAIVRGANACVELKRFEEAITWCDKGLAIDKNNKTLFELKARSVNELKKLTETQNLKCKGEGTKHVTETTQKDAVSESEDTASDDKATDFDDNSLRERAEVYKNKGNYEYSKKNLSNAIHFYTEGIKVNCKDDELNAKLYSNRAIAHLHLGNYENSLRDARAATDLQPTFLKAIERGAIVCMKLNRFDEAITWCDKGLAIDKNNKTLLELRINSVKEQNKQWKPDGEKTEKNLESHIVKGAVAKKLGDKAGEGSTYGNLGNTFLSLGDFRKAINCYELCLKIAKEERDKALEGRAYGSLGIAFCNLGEFRKAIDYHQLHLEISKNLGDNASEGTAYGNIGIAFGNLGNFKKAIDYYELQLKIAKEVGDKAGEGCAYGNLGNAFQSLGDFKKAKDYHELDLKIAKEIGDKTGEGRAYGNLGIAFCCLGDFRKAIDYYELQLKIAKELGAKAIEGKAYCNLGAAFQGLGNFRKAGDYHEMYLQIAKDVGDKAAEGSAYGNLGIAFNCLGDFRKAIDYYELHLKIAKEVGDKAGEGRACCNLGNALFNVGHFRKAIAYYEMDLNIAKEIEDRAGEGTAYGNLGTAFGKLGNFRKAIDYHELHLKIAQEVGDKAGEGLAYGSLGNAFQSLGDFRKAIDYHELHLKFAKEVENKAGQGSAYGGLGFDYLSLGDFKKAIEYYEWHLVITQEVEDKAGQGRAYGCLGVAFQELGDFRKAIDYHELHLKIAKELGDKPGESSAYGNLGIAFRGLGDFRKAVDYCKQGLKLAKQLGNKAGEGSAYGNLGLAFLRLGDFRKAIDFHELELKIAKEVGNKAGEGSAYGNLGNAFQRYGDFRKAIEYNEFHLKLSKEVGDKAGEGRAYGSLGIAFRSLGDFKKAIEYYELDLKITKEIGDMVGEGNAYGNLGIVFHRLGDFKKAKDYYELYLKIAKEVGDNDREAIAYHHLGISFESIGILPKALKFHKLSVRLFNHVRDLLQYKDEWKINFRNKVDAAYTGLFRVLLEQGKVGDALCAAEKGRAQALTDLMLSQFGFREDQSVSHDEDEQYLQLKRYISSCTVFQAFDNVKINLWVLSRDQSVHLGQKRIDEVRSLLDNPTCFLQSLVDYTYKQIGVRSKQSEVRCENRSLETLGENCRKADENLDEERSQPFVSQESVLNSLYNILIQPITDLLQGDELVIVPDGPLWLAPYAALVDTDSKYLCDSFRIRLIPSLTSLKLLAECPDEYHSRSGALLVGDPCVQEVKNEKDEQLLDPLPFAREEVEMIGQILNVMPLVGKKATKGEVLNKLNSVALVHIAAHGRMETGEIALTPDPHRASRIPRKEDYLLTMKDVLSVKLRARLVVLSCCHSGRGEIKAEGVVGIARAFMGAGARSVLVSLWAIDDEATLEFMKSFYHHLVEGKSASESLNKAMNCLRESDKYSDVEYWAPFVLIGDDVTLDFNQKK